MTKKETEEFMELSLKCFGKKYDYKKLMKKGLIAGRDKDSGHIRRIPLTVEQTKNYMIKAIEMREAAIKDMEKKNESSSE